jgi:hypothetical protein
MVVNRDHRRDLHRPRGRSAGPAVDSAQSARDQRPSRPDRVRATDHRQDHRPETTQAHSRADGAPTLSRQVGRSDPGGLCHHPAQGSPRKLVMEFARFLGLPPVKRGYNTTDIADAVCQIMLAARVDLVLVDELHNLNLATAGRGRHVRSPQILHRAPAGDLRLRRCCPPFGVSM